MKLVIGVREFDVKAQPFIGDLRLLKTHFGFGWGTVATRLQSLDQDVDVMTLIDDDDFVEALQAWMFMARLRAGERDVQAVLEDVRMTPLDGFTFKAEPGDELPADGSVPTSAPADSSRGEHEPATVDAPSSEAPSTPSSTKTSKKRSTAA